MNRNMPYLTSLIFALAVLPVCGRAGDVDYSKTRPQNVFPTPKLNPMAERAWGEPAIAWHDGEYCIIYDTFPVEGGPACLMTSRDGVYWREEGAVLWPLAGEQCIECPDIRRFEPNGPFVINYDARVDGRKATRFAISRDLRHWEKLGDVLRRDPKLYNPFASYVHFSIPDEDGNRFYAAGAYTPSTHVGTGLVRSDDGILWEQLPAPHVEGVIDHQFGLDSGPGWKALETSAIIRLAGRYFILGGNPAMRSDVIVTSKDICGPYRPTPKNHMLLRTPQIFHRIYDLPDGYLGMPMIWVNRDRKYYHVAPFRRVNSDGESLWFTWWEGNEKLKAHELPVCAEVATGDTPAVRMLNKSFDLSQGLVFETSLPLNAGYTPEPNLARHAKVRVENTYSKPWWPEGYFAAEKAIDDRETTSWMGHLIPNKTTVDFQFDLQKDFDIGRIEVSWHPWLDNVKILHSADGDVWETMYDGEARSFWKDLALHTQHLRLELTPKPRSYGKKPAEIKDHIAGIAEIGLFAAPRELLQPTTTGFIQMTEDGNAFAWLFERNGRVRFGRLTHNLRAFEHVKTRDLEVDFGDRVSIRVIQRDDLVDLYINDYQVDYYHLKGTLSGRFGLITSHQDGNKPDLQVRAWRPDPTCGGIDQ
jgi:hypothetical protein